MTDEITEQQTSAEDVTEEPHGDDARTDTDWKSEAKKWEKRSKENRAALDNLKAQYEAASDAASKLTDAEERAARAEEEVARLNAERERAEMLKRVSDTTGIDASVLRGDTEEELTAHADAIKALINPYPSFKDSGEQPKTGMRREQILAITNEKERLAAIREHAELFAD